MVAWGYRVGQWTPAQMANLARAAGYEWIALELDDFTNVDFWAEHVWECESHGLIPGCWFTEGGNLYQTPHDAKFAIAELEGPGDYEGIVNVINGVGAGPLPTCSLAVCTNFNYQGSSQPLIDAGMACLTEAYLGDNANATPDALDHQARSRGWPTSQPVFGVWNAPPSAYAQWADWPGVDYLLENVL